MLQVPYFTNPFSSMSKCKFSLNQVVCLDVLNRGERGREGGGNIKDGLNIEWNLIELLSSAAPLLFILQKIA